MNIKTLNILFLFFIALFSPNVKAMDASNIDLANLIKRGELLHKLINLKKEENELAAKLVNLNNDIPKNLAEINLILEEAVVVKQRLHSIVQQLNEPTENAKKAQALVPESREVKADQRFEKNINDSNQFGEQTRDESDHEVDRPLIVSRPNNTLQSSRQSSQLKTLLIGAGVVGIGALIYKWYFRTRPNKIEEKV